MSGISTNSSFDAARAWWAKNRPRMVALAAVGAVLLAALALGDNRYGNRWTKGLGLTNPFTNVDSSLPTGSSGDEYSPAARPTHRPASAESETRAQRTPAPLPAPASPPPSIASFADAQNFSPIDQAEKENEESARRNESNDAGQEKIARGDRTPPQTPAEHSSQAPVPAENLKIIKTGELTVEADVYADAFAAAEKIVAEMGAFIADAVTREQPGGALLGRVVIRVAPQRFEETFAALKSLGRVELENVKTADVTAEYVDIEARITSLKITEERLRELIANKSFVDKIASLLEVERELNRVRTEIESFEGRLRVMADRIALSTIIFTIREPGRTVPAAALVVEVPTLDEAVETLGSLLSAAGGRLISGKTSKRSDGTLMGNYQLQVTLSKFTDVITGIDVLGRVQERQLSDQQFGAASEEWARQVQCAITLTLYERSRQLPTAAIRLEVDEFDEAMRQLAAMLEAHEAVMAGNQVSRQPNGSDQSEIKVRVPAGKFAALFEELPALGRVIAKNTAGEIGHMTGGVALVPADISLALVEKPREVPKGTMTLEVATFETARQALSSAIAAGDVQVLSSNSSQRSDGTWSGTFRLGIPARNVEPFVARLESLGRVSARQINGLGLGDLSRVDADALAMIDLTLGEKATITPASSESAASIRTRIRDGLSGFYSSIGMIAYGLTVMLPWLVLAAVILLIMSRFRMLQNRRKSAAA